MARIITVSADNAGLITLSTTEAGHAGDSNVTTLRITIPSDFSAFNKYLEFVPNGGGKTQTLVSSENTNVFDYLLPYELMKQGALRINIKVAQGTTTIWHSDKWTMVVKPSIGSTAVLEATYHDTIQQLLIDWDAYKADIENGTVTVRSAKDFDVTTGTIKTNFENRYTKAQVDTIVSDTISGIELDLSGKVDKETGKGLSTEDYTTAEKLKLQGIATGAEVNVQSDWNQTNNTSDTYIQNKPTIKDFDYEITVTTETVLYDDYTLTGLYKINHAPAGATSVYTHILSVDSSETEDVAYLTQTLDNMFRRYNTGVLWADWAQITAPPTVGSVVNASFGENATAPRATADASGNLITTTYAPLSQKAAANGIATLDANTKIPFAQNTNNLKVSYTVDAAYKTGTLSVDVDTNTFTLTAHGFADGDPVEFNAGTGVLPTGVIANDFYYVYAKTDNTFQIVPTYNSTTPVDITSAGTVGFKIRPAGIGTAISLTGLDIDTDGIYELFGTNENIPIGASTGIGINLNAVSTSGTYRSSGALTTTGSFIVGVASTNKYGQYKYRLRIERGVNNNVSIFGEFAYLNSTDNFSTYANTARDVVQGTAFITANITSITINPAATRWIRNGSKIYVRRVL